MAYYNASELVQRCIRRLRQVAGPSTQLYAEDVLLDMLQETYDMVRSRRWWDHLMKWEERQLDGVTGTITIALTGVREGFRDVQQVCYGNQSRAIPTLTHNINPHRLSGTMPRFVEPLHVSDDSGSVLLFRIWPLTSVTTEDEPIRIRLRSDPTGIFSNPAVTVPFDATVLINGACLKYAADDGANPSTVAVLQAVFEDRLRQLERQHDAAIILKDPRMDDARGLTEWVEER